ncbi:MAG: RNA polymerase sigma factor [Kutzneria sp.]|nr:RNA polymerase sigma factor [Kutzneria sp.]MBV9844032.1 RNA polymerase sigma factor [Kutzneria sp.]
MTAGIRPEPDVRDAAVTAIGESLSDPERFGEVYDLHATAVHRYLSRRAGAALADDLTAETFLAAFRGRRRFDLTARTALPWLYGIATNLVRRHRRAEVAQYRAMARTGVDPVFADNHADLVADRVVAVATGTRLSGALARLTAKERDTLLLFAWGELNYDDIAAALHIPVGTVRSRLNRARRRLRATLGDTTNH